MVMVLMFGSTCDKINKTKDRKLRARQTLRAFRATGHRGQPLYLPICEGGLPAVYFKRSISFGTNAGKGSVFLRPAFSLQGSGIFIGGKKQCQKKSASSTRK